MSVRIADWGGEPLARPGDDPDSFVRREGADAFRRFLARAKPAGEWIIIQEERKLSPEADAMERAEVVQRLLKVIRDTIDPIERASYRRRIAIIGGVSEIAIANLVGDRLYPPPVQHGGVSIP